MSSIQKRLRPLWPVILVIVLLFASIAAVILIASLTSSSVAGQFVKDNYIIISMIAGMAAAFLVFAIEFLMAQRPDVKSVIASSDGKVSISKAQTWWWSLAIMAAYVAVFTAGYIQFANHGLPAVAPALNSDLLIVLGLSATNVIAAKAIIVRQIATGQRRDDEIPSSKKARLKFEDLITGPGNQVDIYKLQLVAWTLIAVCIFGVQTVRRITEMDFVVATEVKANNPVTATSSIDYMRPEAVAVGVERTEETTDALADKMSLPSIGAELLLLMGISQATYLGGKLVTAPGKFMVTLSHADWPTPETDPGVMKQIVLVNANGRAGDDQGVQMLSGWKLALLPAGDENTIAKAVFPLPVPPGKEILSLKGGEQLTLKWTTDPRAAREAMTWHIGDNPPEAGDALVLRDMMDIEIGRVWLNPPTPVFG